jgi:hypothetical protein
VRFAVGQILAANHDGYFTFSAGSEAGGVQCVVVTLNSQA